MKRSWGEKMERWKYVVGREENDWRRKWRKVRRKERRRSMG